MKMCAKSWHTPAGPQRVVDRRVDAGAALAVGKARVHVAHQPAQCHQWIVATLQPQLGGERFERGVVRANHSAPGLPELAAGG